MFGTFAKFAMAAALVFGSASVFAHDNNAYSHDSNVKTRNPAWLQDIPGSRRLSELSLPGTHDSMSYKNKGAYVDTQALSLESQLESGIRVLDIRVRPSSGAFAIHHGPIYLDASFGDVLLAVKAFLEAHPSETIVMRVSNDGGSAADALGIMRSHYLADPRFADLFWKNAGYSGIDKVNPQLKDIRGRVVLLRKSHEFTSSLGEYGVPYPDTGSHNNYSQDNYFIGRPLDQGMYDKWKDVRKAMGWISDFKTSANVFPPLSINYLSGTGVQGGSLSQAFDSSLAAPFFVASGHTSPATNGKRLSTGHTNAEKDKFPDFPRTACVGKWCTISYEGMNTLFAARLGSKTRVGMVMADFPGPGLIKGIIDRNRGMDLGYGYSRRFVDIDGDGDADMCRAVGTSPNTFLSCILADGKAMRLSDVSVTYHADLGYTDARWMPDINGDGNADYCREVGNRKNKTDSGRNTYITCALSNGSGHHFAGDIRIMGTRDLGYIDARWFADVSGDGKDDFCREIGDRKSRKSYISCLVSTGTGFEQHFEYNGDLGYTASRMWGDVDGDGDADFCREVGNKGKTFLTCALSTGSGFDGHFEYSNDLGYTDSRWLTDIDGDGDADFCRVVGNPPRTVQWCALSQGRALKFDGRIVMVADSGYGGQRYFADFDGDGAADFIREVGDRPRSIYAVSRYRDAKWDNTYLRQ